MLPWQRPYSRKGAFLLGNLSGESREQNRQDKVTRFRSVTYAR